MDKLHEKSFRLFPDVKLGNLSEFGFQRVKECNLESFRACYYCPKVFYKSEYLIKHILRRHTENLLSLHNNLADILKSAPDDELISKRSIINTSSEHVGVTKKERKRRKHHVTSDICDKSCHESNKTMKESPSAKNGIIEENKLTRDESVMSFASYKEFEVVKSKIFEIEGFVKDLCTQMEQLQVVVKDNMSFKQEILKEISLNENKMLQNQKAETLKLKQILMSEFQHMLLDKCRKKSSWGEKYPDLKSEMNKLDYSIQSLCRQINSPEYFKQLETNFEKKFCSLIENSKPSQKLKTVPKYTKEHSKILTSKVSTKNSKALCKPTHQDVGMDVLSRKNPSDVKFLLQQKLQSLGIAPSENRIPTAKYESKMQLLNTERELMCKREQNFMEVYNSINSIADRETLAKMRVKKMGGQRVLPQYKMEQINSSSSKMKADKSEKQGSTGFIVSDDGISEDFKHSFPRNEENASIISSHGDSIAEYSFKKSSNVQHVSINHSIQDPKNNVSYPNGDEKDFDELSLQSLSSLSDEEFQRSPSSRFKHAFSSV